MAKQRDQIMSENTAQRFVVVHVKLPVRMRNALKAALSLEGATMQDYFAAKAAEKIALPTQRDEPATDSLQHLAPGQTYRMPTGRYIHWCVVCGTLWRSQHAQPSQCGYRNCHSPHWRTGQQAV
jgi:hypothetical protein